VLLIPAARGSSEWLGWLPLWLVGMPLAAWWSLRGFPLPAVAVRLPRRRRALDWVKERNAKAEAEIATTPEFKSAGGRDPAPSSIPTRKIPGVQKIGEYYYNFWKDKQNTQRGLWRRTTLAEYRKPNQVGNRARPRCAERRRGKENWVWHGADCLRPTKYERCLIALSRGGSDADVTREFDLTPSSS
jgi:prolyl oligopeptidase